MATTETIFPLSARSSMKTGTLAAYHDVIEDGAGAAPTSLTPVLVFIDTALRYAEWVEQVPSHYSGGGFTWSYKGGTDGTGTAAIHMDLAMKVIADNTGMTSDLGMDSQTVSSIDDAQVATADDLQYSSTSALTHANAGSPSPGDYVIIRLLRDTAGDSNADFAQIAKLLILET